MNPISLIGTQLLTLSVPVALFSMLMYIVGVITSRERLVESAKRANTTTLVLITTSMLLLVYAFVTHHYEIQYVSSYSSRSLPLFYKVTGLWAGLNGSLLLWTWLVSLYAWIVLKQNHDRNPDWMPYINACLMTLIIFFLGIMLFANNPFDPVPTLNPPPDGQGLNPLLQNIAMVIHPPLLYLGFTGFAVPFSFVIAALITRRLDSSWIEDTRRWTLIAWLFLSAGLILGGAWAYVELGWGGFWAWDPVENAGLLPWLLAIAYLHSVLLQKNRGMFKVWNVTLIILIFMLTIFGTYMTRSGVVQSVHAFGENKMLGSAFLSFLAMIGLFSFYLVISRLKDLKSENILASFFSKESAFLFNNIVLLIATVTILWGTMFPTLSEFVTGERITVGQPFFNRIMAPVALALLLLMGVGPMVSWKHTTKHNLKRNLLVPFLFGLATSLIIYLNDITHWYVVSSMGLGVFALGTIIVEFYRGIRVTQIQKKLGFLPSFLDLLVHSNRRFGGYIVHFGILFIFLGIAGTVYKTEADFTLLPGQAYDFQGYTFSYDHYNIDEDAHKTVMSTEVNLLQRDKIVKTLNPSRHFYFSSQQPTTEVDIYQTSLLDVYLIVGNVDTQSGKADFKVTFNPYISFVWLGGIVLVLGIIIVLLPRGLKRKSLRGDHSQIPFALIFCFLMASGVSLQSAMAQGHEHNLPDDQISEMNAPENDPHVTRLKGVAEKLICQCGGCVRESLKTCTCDFAKEERQKISALIKKGDSDQNIVDQFVKKYGLQVLSSPPEEGFFYLGYLLPPLFLIVGLVLALFLARKWQRHQSRVKTDSKPPAQKTENPFQKQFQKELEDF